MNLAGSELPFYTVEELEKRLAKFNNLKYSALSYYERKYDQRVKFSWKFDRYINSLSQLFH